MGDKTFIYNRHRPNPIKIPKITYDEFKQYIEENNLLQYVIDLYQTEIDPTASKFIKYGESLYNGGFDIT